MALSNVLDVFRVGKKVLEGLSALVVMAEGLFGSGTGEQKRNFVVEMFGKLFGSIEDIATGGAKETWQGINKSFDVIGGLIDLIVTSFNLTDKFPNTTPDDEDHAN